MSDPVFEENRRVDQLLGALRPPVRADVADYADLCALRGHWQHIEAVPVIAAERGAGLDQSWAGLDIRTVLRGEHSSGRFAVHNIELVPGAGLAAHYQEDLHTYLLVTAGQVELGIGRLVESVGQHSLGYAPPLTRIGFRNRSATPAQLVVVYSPAGAERAFEAAHHHWVTTHDDNEASYHDVLARFGFHFDSTPLDNDARTNEVLPEVDFVFTGEGDLEALRAEFSRRPALPRLVRTTPDEVDAKGAGASRRKQLMNGDYSAGNAMINLLSGLPGFGAPAHHQPTEEEMFFITDGFLDVTCANQTMRLGSGAFAFCPRNCTHAFVNTTDSEVRFATMNSPAGHERAMEAVRLLARQGAPKEQLHALAVAGRFVFHSVDDLG